mgnify:CR=1 FL=1
MFSGRPVKAEIDLEAFRHNITVVESLVGESELMLVIKADAYGHGLIPMAKATLGKDLAVAVPEELARLLSAGIKNRVWVLEGPFSQACLELSTSTDVVWVIHSLWQLELIKARTSTHQLNICIKLDTGMHRLGFNQNDLVVCLSQVSRMQNINIVSTMSHFSKSESAISPSLESQIMLYEKMLSENNISSFPQSLANSGAILSHCHSHRERVRPGIMLYGDVDPEQCLDQIESTQLKPVMLFKSAIISLQSIPAGEGVGYGSTWIAERDSIIATVAGGYGDGYPRHAPNGTPIAVTLANNEVEIASLVGTVSMDMLSIDVTDIVGVKVGGQVELWGADVSVNEIARLCGTISYELLCGVTARVPRNYL